MSLRTGSVSRFRVRSLRTGCDLAYRVLAKLAVGEVRMSGEVAVVGGGPAGLAAAWSLVSAGRSVTLYERAENPGGLLRTAEIEGLPVDVGVQLLGSYYSETYRLAREAGGSELLVRSPGRDALWRGGRAHLISYGSLASMASSGALPTGLKLRLASRYLLYLRRNSEILHASDPVRAVSLDGESIASWGERELGSDFVELLVYPQLASYYGGTPEETSAGFYHSLASAALDLQVYAVRGGMAALASAIAAGIAARGARLRYGVEVAGVREVGEGVEVECEGGGARYDAVVLAVPAPVALRLADPPGPLREWMGGVEYVDEAVVALSLARPLPVDYFGISFPRIAPPGDRVAAICVQSRKGAGLGGDGRDTLVVIPAPAIMRDLVEADPRGALELVLPSVEMVYPGIRERVVRAMVYRFPESRENFYPGYLRHLAGFDPTWLSPRLRLAGGYLVAPTIEGAVRSGFRAASGILGEV